MGTIVNLGLGVVSTVAKGVKLVTDGKTSGTPDLRMDFKDNAHSEAHYHTGNDKGQEAGGGIMDFLFGVANTKYESISTKYYCCGKKSLESKQCLGDLELYVSRN